MRTQRNAWVNEYFIDKGTEVKVVKSDFDHYANRWQHLFEVCEGLNEGLQFWSSLDLVRPFKQVSAAEWFDICLKEYICAGWDYLRIIKAGLCPAEYRSLLPQYIKYKDKLI